MYNKYVVCLHMARIVIVCCDVSCVMLCVVFDVALSVVFACPLREYSNK